MHDATPSIVGKGAAAASRRETLRRRKEFQGLKIFLPRVLSRHYATNEWRQFDYDRDLLSRLDWATFSYTNRATFTPDEKEALERTLVRVTVEDLGGVDDQDLPKQETTQEDVEPELDFPALVRLLLDVIPRLLWRRNTAGQVPDLLTDRHQSPTGRGSPANSHLAADAITRTPGAGFRVSHAAPARHVPHQ